VQPSLRAMASPVGISAQQIFMVNPGRCCLRRLENANSRNSLNPLQCKVRMDFGENDHGEDSRWIRAAAVSLIGVLVFLLAGWMFVINAHAAGVQSTGTVQKIDVIDYGTYAAGAKLTHATFDESDLRALPLSNGTSLAVNFEGAGISDAQLARATVQGSL